MKTEPTWTTRDGTVLKIRDMETSHIENCIAMLERNAWRQARHLGIACLLYAETAPEGAAMAAEAEAEGYFEGEADTAYLFPEYVHLAKELKRRKRRPVKSRRKKR